MNWSEPVRSVGNPWSARGEPSSCSAVRRSGIHQTKAVLTPRQLAIPIPSLVLLAFRPGQRHWVRRAPVSCLPAFRSSIRIPGVASACEAAGRTGTQFFFPLFSPAGRDRSVRDGNWKEPCHCSLPEIPRWGVAFAGNHRNPTGAWQAGQP